MARSAMRKVELPRFILGCLSLASCSLFLSINDWRMYAGSAFAAVVHYASSRVYEQYKPGTVPLTKLRLLGETNAPSHYTATYPPLTTSSDRLVLAAPPPHRGIPRPAPVSPMADL